MYECTVEEYLDKLISTIDESIEESRKRATSERDFIETMKTLRVRIEGRSVVKKIKSRADITAAEETIFLIENDDGLLEAYWLHDDELENTSDICGKALTAHTSNIVHSIMSDLHTCRDPELIDIIEHECDMSSGIHLNDLIKLKRFYDDSSKLFDVICLKNRISASDMRYLYANIDCEIVA